jgi:hypothetical protein
MAAAYDDDIERVRKAHNTKAAKKGQGRGEKSES